MRLSIIAFLPLLMGLAGCGAQLLSNRATNPVLSDYYSASWTSPVVYSTVATTAGRRLIFMLYELPHQPPKVCAEPPPDAVDSLASALTASAKGSAPQGPTAQLTFGQSFGTSSGLGIYRSQGLQMIRDRAFLLCMEVIQGWITPAQFNQELDTVTTAAIPVIEKEFDVMKAAATRPYLVVGAPSLSPVNSSPGGSSQQGMSGANQSGGNGTK